GATSARLAIVLSISPGAGRPRSMYRLPPLRRMRLKLWLPPNVWLHGSQSTITGGGRPGTDRNGQHAARPSWFEVSIRWVLTTPLGAPVEPEVNRTLAIVSGAICENVRSSAGERVVRAS